jgi:hypothetical protein
MALTQKERSAKWYANLKKDPERYKKILANRNAWKKKSRKTNGRCKLSMKDRQQMQADKILLKLGLNAREVKEIAK